MKCAESYLNLMQQPLFKLIPTAIIIRSKFNAGVPNTKGTIL
jgi:hypothetical protein